MIIDPRRQLLDLCRRGVRAFGRRHLPSLAERHRIAAVVDQGRDDFCLAASPPAAAMVLGPQPQRGRPLTDDMSCAVP